MRSYDGKMVSVFHLTACILTVLINILALLMTRSLLSRSLSLTQGRCHDPLLAYPLIHSRQALPSLTRSANVHSLRTLGAVTLSGISPSPIQILHRHL